MRSLPISSRLFICGTLLLAISSSAAAPQSPVTNEPPPAAAASQEKTNENANSATAEESSVSPSRPATETTATDEAATEKKPDVDTAPEAQPQEVKSKFQLTIPSTRAFWAKSERSKIGQLFAHIGQVSEQIREEKRYNEDASSGEWRDVLQVVRDWPDTRLRLAVFTPDINGQPRWALQIGLPAGQVHELIANLTKGDEHAEFFEGLTDAQVDGEYVYSFDDAVIAILKSSGEQECYLRSHPTVQLPTKFFDGVSGDGEPVLSARLELTSTEKDSGSTFLSSFKLVTFVDYTTRIDEAGVWHDQLRAGWPMVSWLTVKALLGQPSQSFYTPSDAFLGAVLEANGAKTLLEQSAGLKLKKGSGGEGPVERFGGDEVLLTILPGVGFIPAPEIVAQCRIRNRDRFSEALQERIAALDKEAEQTEQKSSWHEVEVRGLRVFWCDLANRGSGNVVPFLMRPVLFLQKAKDDRKREREFLIVGWTSTNPVRFVERWLDRPRDPPELRYLPASRKHNFEAWVHWQQLYDWIHPYVNLGLSEISVDAILDDEIGTDIPDAMLSGDIKMAGMIVSHEGPVPLGLLAVPAMASTSLQETRSSDLARERLARRQLQVLYHHCRLFQQDTGRWPVRVAELDGYVDFAGNQQLLKLEESSQKRFGKMFSRIFSGSDDDGDKKTDDDAEDSPESVYDVDDSIYEIVWEDGEWQLGYAPGKLEHLSRLYIDMNGDMHREQKPASSD